MELKGASLTAMLNSGIDAQTDDDTSRADIVSQMARAAGIATDTVNAILNADVNCPPLRRLEGFAEVLDVSMASLRSAAESDGCEYSEDGKAFSCRLIKKTANNEVTSEFIKYVKKKYSI